jgi:hypothetical protein
VPIEVASASTVASALTALSLSLFRGIADTSYAVSSDTEEGQRELLVQDPDGHLL